MIKGEMFDYDMPEDFDLGSFILDVNLEKGRGAKTALYHGDGTYRFDDLWSLTSRMGNVLRKLWVEPENRTEMPCSL